jgi:hypothetical protein
MGGSQRRAPLVRKFPLWIFPLISGTVWFCMWPKKETVRHATNIVLGVLWAMIIVWLAQGQPKYPSMEPTAHIAYISDVGKEQNHHQHPPPGSNVLSRSI